MVEFALVLLPLTLVVYGLVAFGLVFGFKQSLTNAASEGARSAVGSVRADAATVAKNTVNQRLAGTKYLPSDTTATVIDCTTGLADAAAGNCVKVSILYPYASRPLVPEAPGIGLVTPTKLTADATVKFA